MVTGVDTRKVPYVGFRDMREAASKSAHRTNRGMANIT